MSTFARFFLQYIFRGESTRPESPDSSRLVLSSLVTRGLFQEESQDIERHSVDAIVYWSPDDVQSASNPWLKILRAPLSSSRSLGLVGTGLESMCDNIFEEDLDLDSRLAEKEWEKLMADREKDGLRDGLFDGNEKGLQEGFDVGFSKGFSAVYSLHAMKGVLKAIDENRGISKDLARGQSLTKLTAQLDDLEKRLVEALVSNPSEIDAGVKDGFEEIKAHLKVLCTELSLESLAGYVDHFSLLS